MRGGHRNGAGRKKGSSSKLQLQEAFVELEEKDLKNPLTIMMQIMNNAYNNGNGKLALIAAKYAAPYVHAQLNRTELDARVDVGKIEELSKDELQSIIQSEGKGG